jgi:hypothetical protein
MNIEVQYTFHSLPLVYKVTTKIDGGSSSSRMLVVTYQTTLYHKPEDYKLLLVPRNFSRGRGVIPSLAEQGGAV